MSGGRVLHRLEGDENPSAPEGLIPMLNDYLAGLLAADRASRLITEADAYRLAESTRQPKRPAGRLMPRWLQALRPSSHSGLSVVRRS